jgi:hypothetical protein
VLRTAPGCGTIAFFKSDRPAERRQDERYGDEPAASVLIGARVHRHGCDRRGRAEQMREMDELRKHGAARRCQTYA